MPVPRPPLGSGKLGLCGTELPSRAVVQSARRAPSGAAGSSGRGEAALCELPCWLSRCLLGGRTHLPALRPHPQEVLGLGGRRQGRCHTGCPALSLWPHRPGCATALLPTALGTLWGPGPPGYNHVSQEAQRLLWGLWMVGGRGGWPQGWELTQLGSPASAAAAWGAVVRGLGLCLRPVGRWVFEIQGQASPCRPWSRI